MNKIDLPVSELSPILVVVVVFLHFTNLLHDSLLERICPFSITFYSTFDMFDSPALMKTTDGGLM